ncbi:MAG: acyltransferase [Cytophagales bacterium]|nr:acyltransferase [Cytophagales bacterium]
MITGREQKTALQVKTMQEAKAANLQKKGRNLPLDLLKLLMSFFVVFSHSNMLRDIDTFTHHIADNALFRATVPCFLIISGYYFYKVIERKKIRLWAKRFAITYGIWMTVYIFFWIPREVNSATDVFWILKTVFYGYYHLWYLSGALCAGTMLYYLQRKLSDFSLVLTGLALYSAGVLLQYSFLYDWFEGSAIHQAAQIESSFRNFLFYAFPFFLSGYLIKKHNLANKIKKQHLRVLLALSLVSLFCEIYFHYLNTVKTDGYIHIISYTYACPLAIMSVLAMRIQTSSQIFARMSAGIYYIHPLFLILFWTQDKFSTVFVGTASLLMSALGALLLIQINKKVKYLL